MATKKIQFISSSGDDVLVRSGKPCCPNHAEPLEDIPEPMPNKGSGRCPVSGQMFSFEISTGSEVITKDKNGNLDTTYEINMNGTE